jgi:tetratricopeptide (TPR) repeat protein
LNPKDANIVVEYGWGLTYAGRPQEGIPLMQEAMRLNPYHPGYYWALLSDGYFVAGQYQDAIANLEKVPHPHSTVYRRMAATYALLGRMEEARAALAKHRELEPQISLAQVAATTPFKRPEDLQRFFDGLRKAGLQ